MGRQVAAVMLVWVITEAAWSSLSAAIENYIMRGFFRLLLIPPLLYIVVKVLLSLCFPKKVVTPVTPPQVQASNNRPGDQLARYGVIQLLQKFCGRSGSMTDFTNVINEIKGHNELTQMLMQRTLNSMDSVRALTIPGSLMPQPCILNLS